MIKFKTLSEISLHELAACFNLAFSDYLIPLALSLNQLETKLYSESINKAISIGAFRDGELVGFILHGDRKFGNKRIAYNAGTGVIPAARGQGLTKRMYNFIKPKLTSHSFEEVVLEVISTNIPAIKTYEKVGFEPIRNLSCFKGDLLVTKINEAS